MEKFLLIFFTLLSFSKVEADDDGEWMMEQPIYKLPGETFQLLYKSNVELVLCSFKPPDETPLQIDIILGNSSISNVTNPPNKRPSEWTWEWYGTDTKKDCGIQINRADIADSGKWTAKIVTSSQIDRYANVTILDAPNEVLLEPPTIDAISMSPVISTSPINITCTAYETRGITTFTWWIGENMLAGNVSEYNITKNDDTPEAQQYMDVSQVFHYVPDPSHDNKELICNASHSQYDNDELVNKTNIDTIHITILAPPVPPDEDIVFPDYPLGDNLIEIRFHANPAPDHIYWEMHDLGQPLTDNQTSGRYISEGWGPAGAPLTRLATGDYIATLKVSQLSRSDAGLANALWVENHRGNTSYAFTFNDIKGLTVGEIAGIAVGCVAGVILVGVLIGVLVNNRSKKRSKKIKQERRKNREEGREESRAQGQENPEFEDVAM